jgi:L-ascorbate metabolism protein UlaG (beta-lactamase superfamily)
MRNPLKGPNCSLWGSFIIRTAGGPTIFIAGDAAYFDRFQEIGAESSIDLAVFNLGAYEPRWFMAQSHMNPLEVVKAFEELRASRLMVVHWGTFRLGDEPVHFPPQDLQKALAAKGLLDRLVHLDHGQTLYYRGRNIANPST